MIVSVSGVSEISNDGQKYWKIMNTCYEYVAPQCFIIHNKEWYFDLVFDSLGIFMFYEFYLDGGRTSFSHFSC